MNNPTAPEWSISPSVLNPINYIKGNIKSLLSRITQTLTMTNNPQVQEFLSFLEELYQLANRENLNQPHYLFSRRQKALVAKEKAEQLHQQGLISEADYAQIKKTLSQILFENFSKQILPAKTGIIPANQQKTETYFNFSKAAARKILEPREYIGIVPEALTDLDAPSLVTALTPPHYEQPWHDHGENREITFYDGPSIWKYMTEGVEHEIHADFGDVIIFPPQTRHTIQNPTDTPVRNLSIKLPSALLDRGKSYKGALGQGEKRSIKLTDENYFTLDLADIELPYQLRVYRFDAENPLRTLQFPQKALLYPLQGEYLVSTELFQRKTFRAGEGGDSLVLDKNTQLQIESLDQDGKIYCVVLNENWESTV